MSKSDQLLSKNPQRILCEFCIKEQILYIDLLPIFRKNSHLNLYHSMDDHPAINGHRVMGEAIAGFLDSLKSTL